MPRTSILTYLWWLAGPLLLALACSHDAPRDNPLDPTLTPPVELQVALDDTAGAATLTWTRYEGEAEFVEYWVLRNIARSTEVDTLARIGEATQTTYVDTELTPETEYGYRASAVSVGSLEAPSAEARIDPMNLPAVEVLGADFSARDAAAAVSWTAYVGPRFRSYSLMRSQPGLVAEVVAETPDRLDTAHVDAGLAGNTEYTYQVVVHTQRDEEVPSGKVSGRFHALVASWPLEVTEDGYVRLYRVASGRIAVLVSRDSGVRMLKLNPDGSAVWERQLLSLPLPGPSLAPRTATLAVRPNGHLFVSLGVRPRTGITWLAVAEFSRDGVPQSSWQQDLFVDELSGYDSSAGEEVALVAVGSFPSSAQVRFDNVSVWAAEELVFTDDFGGNAASTEWDLVHPDTRVEDGALMYSGTLWPLEDVVPSDAPSLARKRDASWTSLRVEADVALMADLPYTEMYQFPTVRIGRPDQGAVVTLSLYRLGMLLGCTLDAGLYAAAPVFLSSGWTYRLGLSVVDRRVRASMQSPLLWFSEREDYSPWACLVGMEDVFALVHGEGRYDMGPERQRYVDTVDSPISEARVWTDPASGDKLLGVCWPHLNTVAVSPTVAYPSRGRLGWEVSKWSPSLGTGTGHEPGQLHYPLSFDVAPDGRTYVLDAGNSRIQVFDNDRKPLTHWGGRGAADGLFDFGSGRTPEDFSGSVCVDDEGFIYVADVGNQRIQKFAP